MKTCYYTLLGVDRTATPEEIRTAFKEKALQHHPDKNPTNPEEATVLFQLLREAYECLSNAQDRAWYDAHRIQILCGGEEGDYQSSSHINLWQYFSSDCFSGYSDSDGGFYRVYDEIFKRIDAAELEEASPEGIRSHQEDTLLHAPYFGSSTSSNPDVTKFYSYWSNFYSIKGFYDADEMNPKEGANRRESRLIAKHNMKLRSIAKKEFSEQVRALVSWVKKRDKRIHCFQMQKLKEQKQEAVERERFMQQLKEMKSKHREKQLQSDKERWAEMQKEQQALVQEGLQEFHTRFTSEENMDEVPTVYVCLSCDKRFKSEQQYAAHERSKKHIKNLQAYLAKQGSEVMQASSVEDEDEVSFSEPQTSDTAPNIVSTEKMNDAFAGTVIDSHAPDAVKSSQVKANLSASEEGRVVHVQDEVEERQRESSTSSESSATESDVEIANYFVKLRVRDALDEYESDAENSDSRGEIKRSPSPRVADSEDVGLHDTKGSKKHRKKKVVRGAVSVPMRTKNSESSNKPKEMHDEVDASPWKCEVCSSAFASRNKLFQHINQEGHAVLKTVTEPKHNKKKTRGK